MSTIAELEKKVWSLIEDSTKKKDTQSLGKLNGIAEKLKGLKNKFEALKKQLETLEGSNEEVKKNGVRWKVTEGAIRQNLLNIKEAKKAGILPPDGDSINVETSVGTHFDTKVVYTQNKLQERGEIKRFYEMADVKAGDELSLKVVGDGKYLLEKVSA